MKKLMSIMKLINGKKTIIASLYWGTIMPSLALLYPEGVPPEINRWVTIAGFLLTSLGLGHKYYKKVSGAAVLLLCVALMGCGGKKTIVTDTAYAEVENAPESGVVLDRYTTPEEQKPVEPVEIPIVDPCIVLFDFDSDNLDNAALDQISSWAHGSGSKSACIIGGACPIGSDAYNLALGLKRASAVAEILQRIGVHVESVDSWGESNLVTHDPKQYQLNRRAVVRTGDY